MSTKTKETKGSKIAPTTKPTKEPPVKPVMTDITAKNTKTKTQPVSTKNTESDVDKNETTTKSTVANKAIVNKTTNKTANKTTNKAITNKTIPNKTNKAITNKTTSNKTTTTKTANKTSATQNKTNKTSATKNKVTIVGEENSDDDEDNEDNDNEDDDDDDNNDSDTSDSDDEDDESDSEDKPKKRAAPRSKKTGTTTKKVTKSTAKDTSINKFSDKVAPKKSDTFVPIDGSEEPEEERDVKKIKEILKHTLIKTRFNENKANKMLEYIKSGIPYLDYAQNPPNVTAQLPKKINVDEIVTYIKTSLKNKGKEEIPMAVLALADDLMKSDLDKNAQSKFLGTVPSEYIIPTINGEAIGHAITEIKNKKLSGIFQNILDVGNISQMDMYNIRTLLPKESLREDEYPLQIIDDKDIDLIADLKFNNGTYILNQSDDESIYEVCNLIMNLGINATTVYVKSVNSLREMIYDSSLMESVREKYKYLLKILQSEDDIGYVEGIYTCPKCGAKKIKTHEIQTRSADEPMTIIKICADCGKKF